MNAASPRIAPAIAETGDSFSSSDRRCAALPQPIPDFDGAITTTIVAAKMAQMGMESMFTAVSLACLFWSRF